MCGIFGYTGSQTAEPLLIKGLRALEYRGYDSAGIFVPGYGVVKAVGPIDNLATKITEPIEGSAGIAHTRWATHGAPTEKNAHPHSDATENIFVVHNGIIENFRDIKEELEMGGITFVSETDSEVLTKLIGSLYKDSLLDALREALKRVRGTYGIAAIDANNPDDIVVARLGSPIVIGISSDGNFVTSDASAVLEYTKDVIYLDDGEMAVISKDAYSITTLEGQHKDKRPEKIPWEADAIQKGGYEHFLLKEIMEIPETIQSTIRGRLQTNVGKAKLGGLESVKDTLVALRRLAVVGCGSATYAGEVGKYMLEEYANLPVDVELASEFRYREVASNGGTALLAVTQSGETADTLASLRKGKEGDMLTLGMVNAVGSTIARESDAGIYNHAGPEISVASTKAFVSQVSAFILLTLFLGRERGLAVRTGTEIANALEKAPSDIRKILVQGDAIHAIAKKYAHYRDFMYIGRGYHAPIAYEASLKLKEVTYIHAEAYAGGELKHGPIAMLDENFPVVAFVPEDEVFEKMVSNIEEVRARNVPVLAVTTEGTEGVEKIADDVIYIPKAHKIVQPMLSVIPMQLFAYFVGIEKGLNVDRPRNLAKSVTVE